jgi:AbrB family looped-hinge helix DNA binding protein
MDVMIRKIGNSEGVIPKEVLNKLGLKNGDSLNLLEADGTIQLVPQSAISPISCAPPSRNDPDKMAVARGS